MKSLLLVLTLLLLIGCAREPDPTLCFTYPAFSKAQDDCYYRNYGRILAPPGGFTPTRPPMIVTPPDPQGGHVIY